MSRSDPPPPEPTPWDLVGEYLGNVAAVTSTIASRNLLLWRMPQGRPDDPERYRKDYERLVEVATENARDMWALSLGVSPRERIAYPLSVVELEFAPIPGEHGANRWQLCEQVVIPVGWAGMGPLPDHAHIELAGDDPAGAAALVRCLRTRLDPTRTGYLLESFDVRELWPGTYAGTVYVDHDKRCPIAQLRVVVAGRPGEPVVPTVMLRWGIPAPRSGGPPPGNACWQPSAPIMLRAPRGGPAPHQTIVVSMTGGDGAEDLAKVLTVTADGSGQAYVLLAADPPASVADGYYTGSAYTIEPEPRALAKLEVVVADRDRDGYPSD